MHEILFVDDGVRTSLSKEYGVSAASITRYLRGQFRDNNPNIELIKEIRERARTRLNGKTIFVARDENGLLHFFPFEPRKEDGIWLNPLDRYTRNEFPEGLLPEGVNPTYADKLPTRLNIIRKKQLKTV